MDNLLQQYRMDPTTWLYVSSLMTIGIYFRFYRFFSIRNLDLIGLIAFAPGLLLLGHGNEHAAYGWLFVVELLFLVRLLIDPVLVRRPLIAPNLSSDGMTFTVVALMAFLIASVLTEHAIQTDPTRFHQTLATQAIEDEEPEEPVSLENSPGYGPFYRFAEGRPARAASEGKTAQYADAASLPPVLGVGVKITAIAAHLAIVLGLIIIGTWHFDNFQTGIATAALYLLLPYVAQFTVRLDHILPGALLVWAIASYRRPVISGLLLGAASIVFYPFLLMPLWAGFYRRRGLIRFVGGVLTTLVAMVLLLYFLSADWTQFCGDLAAMFGHGILSDVGADGFWEYNVAVLRIPVLAALVVLSLTLGLWPLEKNFGNLLSGTAAMMIGAQFVHAYQGGLYMAWFLPILVVLIFRPTLQDRIAVRTVSVRWFARLPEGRDPFAWLFDRLGRGRRRG